MQEYFKQIPRTKFDDPPKRIETGKKVTVPYVGNLSISAATKKLKKEGFDVSTQYVYSNRPKYTFLGWSPGAGSRVSQFSTVYKLVSKGKDPAIEKAKKRREKAEEKEEEGQEGQEGRRLSRRPDVDEAGPPEGDRPRASWGGGACRAAGSAGELAADLGGDGPAVGLALGLRRHHAHDLAHAPHAQLGGAGLRDGRADDRADLLGRHGLRQVVGEHGGLGLLLLRQLRAARPR